MRIADYSIGHGPTVIMFMLTAAVFGVIALIDIPQERVPDIGSPEILIVTQYLGVGPRDVEQQVTKPIENAVASVSGITKITSDSVDSYSLINLQFAWNVNVDLKLPTLREKVNSIMSDLPSELSGPPDFYTFSAADFPILTYVARSGAEPATLRAYVVDHVVPYLERVSGVARVAVGGVPDRQLRVELDLRKLAGCEISPIDVLRLLEANNVNIPAGSVTFRGSMLNVRSVGELASLDDVRNVVVGTEKGKVIRIRDVATVGFAPAKRDIYALYNGKDSLVIDITKQRGTDTIKIIREVKSAAAAIERQAQGAVSLIPVTDESVDIHRSVRSVASSALYGAILAVLILLLVLHNVRSTLIIAVSIPLSVVVAIAGLYGAGRSLNLVTLGGLTVAIGMVVDNSIVVLENSYKHLERGKDPASAASRGTSEVVGAVIASTTTSLAVFVPILFVQGFVGVILKDISFAVIFALAASLLVAVFVVPYLFSRIVKGSGGGQVAGRAAGLRRPRRGGSSLFAAFASASDAALRVIEEAYRRGLRFSLANPGVVIAAALLLLALSVGAVRVLGAQFLPDTDTGQIVMAIQTAPGSTLEQTRLKVLTIEQLIRRMAPEIANAIFYVGESNVVGIGNSATETRGVINLVPSTERRRSVFEIMELLQRRIPANVSDVKVTVQNGGIASNVAAAVGSSGLQIEVSGADFDNDRRAAEAIQGILEAQPDVSAVDMNVDFQKQDLVARYDHRYMASLGVLPADASLASRIILSGMDAGSYRSGGTEYTLYLTSSAADSPISSNLLNQMSIRTQAGSFVNFTAFTSLETEPSYSDIPHLDKIRSIRVTAYLIAADSGSLQARVIPQIERLALPADVSWRITGQVEQMQESFGSLAFALVIAVFLVYVVMVVQFQRFVQPLIIMGSIPFIFVGAIGSLLAFGSSLSIISFLGLITLAGTVVNNAIVLVDYMNMLRREYGLSVIDAVLDGGKLRLRPILMTTLTTILGVVPLALALSEGSSLNASLGQVIGGGLLTSTLITLFLVPTLYYLLERKR